MSRITKNFKSILKSKKIKQKKLRKMLNSYIIGSSSKNFQFSNNREVSQISYK